jgi:hypothetical protein
MMGIFFFFLVFFAGAFLFSVFVKHGWTWSFFFELFFSHFFKV